MNIETLLAEKNKYISYAKKQHKVSEAEGEDIFSEVLIKAWKNKDNIIDLQAWVYQCIMFVGFNYKRTKINKNTTTMENMPDMVCDITPEDIIASKKQCELLLNIINTLPPQQKKAIKLWYIDYLKAEEASKQMKCTIDSAQETRKIALRKIRKVIPDMQYYTLTRTWEYV